MDESFKIRNEIYRKMDISTRARITFELSDTLRGIVIDGIKARHPEYTRQQIIDEVIRLVQNKETIENHPLRRTDNEKSD
jgi:hypothetical protein